MPARWPRLATAALFAVAAAAAPAALSAQETEIGLTVGALTPLASLAQTEDGTSAGLSSSFAVSAGATRWLGERWGLAADGLWATGGPDVTTARDDGPGSPGSGDDGADAGGAGAAYLAGTARLLYRLPSLSGVVEPRFGLGVGLRHVELDESEDFPAVSETDPAAVLSGAVRSSISARTALTVELRDVISFVDAREGTGGSELQNDVIVLVGMSIRP